jgi:hypothetical protein
MSVGAVCACTTTWRPAHLIAGGPAGAPPSRQSMRSSMQRNSGSQCGLRARRGAARELHSSEAMSPCSSATGPSNRSNTAALEFHQPAIHEEFPTRDVGRVFRNQEQRRRGDLFCKAQSLERNKLSELRQLFGLLAGLGVNRCLDHTGADRVDPYATGCKLPGERSSE